MRISTKFSVAVHALILVSVEKEPCSSAWIAGSVNTNPVVIRRIIGLMQKAGILTGIQGKSGYTIMKPASKLTLLDIYKAVAVSESDQLFCIHGHPNINCPVGASIQFLLETVMGDAQNAMEKVLEAVTLQQLIDNMPKSPA